MTQRTKTLSWDDPMISASAVPTMSGIDFMRALQAGEYPPPPILGVMNLGLLSVEEGSVTFTAEPDESHYNPIGAVHGGFACTVLDTVTGCAVHTTLPQGYGYTSLEIKVNYLTPITAGSGTLTAIGTVTKPGKRVAFAEGVLREPGGRVVATASSTLLVFPIPG